MKDKLLQIRVDEDFLSRLEYLRKINGFKTIAETVRKLIEKEYRKEAELPSAQSTMGQVFDENTINKQAAIDAVYERIKQIGYENNPLVLSIRQAIRDLPSAQP